MDASQYDAPVSDEIKVGFWFGVGAVCTCYFGNIGDDVGGLMMLVGIGCAVVNGIRWIDHNRIYKARRVSALKWKK